MDFLTSLISQPWYFNYFSGILVILPGFLLLLFPDRIRLEHHLGFLCGSLFTYGAARILDGFCVVSNHLGLEVSQKVLQFVWVMLLAEFIRRNWKNEFGFFLSPLIQLPMSIVVVTALFLNGDLCFGLGGIPALVLIVLLAVGVFRGASRRGFSHLLFLGSFLALLVILFFIQTFGATLLPQSVFFDVTQSASAVVTDNIRIIQLLFMLVMGLVLFPFLLLHNEKFKRYFESSDFVVSLLLLMLVLVFNFSGAFLTNFVLKEESRKIETSLRQSRRALEKIIDQRILFAETSAGLVAAVPVLADYLKDQNEDSKKSLESFFKSFLSGFPDGICYLMDKEGLVLASSAKQDLFVGRFLNFRSYFKAAIAGTTGRLIDYGKFTNELGYYCAFPVYDRETREILGVCAVKRTLNDLYSSLKLYHPAMLTDKDNKVLLASSDEFLGRQIKILETGSGQKPLSDSFTADEKIFAVKTDLFFVESFPFGPDNWKVLILAGSSSLKTYKLWSLAVFLLLSLVIFAFFYINGRRSELRAAKRQAQTQFESVVYNAPEGIVIISPVEKTILLANHAFSNLMHLSSSPVGSSFSAYVSASTPDFLKESAIVEGGCFIAECRFSRPGASDFTGEVTGAETFFNGARAIILFIHDISARIEHEEKLNAAKTAAEKANREKSRFLAISSHEIRTPLTAIVGLNEVARKLCSSPEQKRLLDLASSSARFMIELLNDILDRSQIDQGKFVAELRQTRVKEIIEQMVEVAGIEAERKDLRIVFAPEADFPEVLLTDGKRLRQIIANLLHNAVKFAPSGTIKVEAGIEGMKEENCRFWFRLSHPGQGISKEFKDDLFADFVNSVPEDLKDFSGAGLGLSISRQLSELLGGELKLHSNKQSEIECILQLPVTRPVKVEKAERERSAEPNDYIFCRQGQPLKILVADDNETNLFLAGAIISELHGEPVCAHDGLEALHLLNSQEFDLALLDIMMPNLDGLSLIKKIRESKQKFRQLPIVALSAFSTEEEKEKAIVAGADSYLAKPYFPVDLLREVKKVAGFELDRVTLVKEAVTEVVPSAEVKRQPRLRQINLKELEFRILQKPENVLQIQQIFSRRSQTLIDDLRRSIKENNSEKLREAAHSVKGLVGMLAAALAFSQAQQIESLAREGRLDEAVEMVPVLVKQIGEVGEDLDQICANIAQK